MLLGNRLWMRAFSVEWVHLGWISKYKLLLKTIQSMALHPSNSPLGLGNKGLPVQMAQMHRQGSCGSASTRALGRAGPALVCIPATSFAQGSF